MIKRRLNERTAFASYSISSLINRPKGPRHEFCIPPAFSIPPRATTTDAAHQLPGLVSRFAFAAALVVLAMFATFVLTGIGQDPLQFVHSPHEYLAILLRNPPVLRLAIGLDNLFIMLYSSMFLALGSSLWRTARYKGLLAASFSLLALSGLLDLLENMHFLTMLATAEQGLAISLSQIELQVWESLIKFHASYLGLFLLGFVLPSETRLEQALCFALRWVQLPVGLLIYLTPREIAVHLVLVRFTFFLLALLALAAVFRQRKFG